MNKDDFSAKWNQFKGKVKEKWGKLKDEDINAIGGKFEQLSAKLQEKYGWTKDKADHEISSWCSSCGSDHGKKSCSCCHGDNKDCKCCGHKRKAS